MKRRDVGNRERKHSGGIDPRPLSGDAVRILNLIESCLQCAMERAVSHTHGRSGCRLLHCDKYSPLTWREEAQWEYESF